MAQPKFEEFEPTQEQRKTVLSMVGFGIPREEICNVLGFGLTTLSKYFQNELDTGVAIANSRVAQNLFRIATGKETGAVSAAIFWLKTRARWRETDREQPETEALIAAAQAMISAATATYVPDDQPPVSAQVSH